jgi:EAL and modified HD-GYP domain-containing signal transduction protein
MTPPTVDAFVARQPILDRRRDVYGYELLFRSGLENFFSHPDVDHAAAKVIHDSLHVFGLDVLAGGRRVFINATRQVVVDDLYAVLPREQAVVELLESVEPDDEVVAACRRVKAAGYQLALDDFVWDDRFERILPFVDLVKVDLLVTRGAALRALVERLRRWPVRLLAEKVETRADLAAADALGFELFQGYFFFRPEIVSTRTVSPTRLARLALLRELHRPELDFARLEEAVKADVSLSVRLVRYLNSAAFGWHERVNSIRQALILLGERPTRLWCSLAVLAALGEEGPPALVLTCLERARFCELLGARAGLGDRELDLFLTGMLSALDALVGRPIEEIVARVGPGEDVRAAVVHRRGPLGAILALALAYERGAWDEVDALAADTPLREAVLPLYREAVVWADRIAGTADDRSDEVG